MWIFMERNGISRVASAKSLRQDHEAEKEIRKAKAEVKGKVLEEEVRKLCNQTWK